MKTYVLMISEYFPKTHPRAGEPTGFPLAIKHFVKIHTIRDNYELWAKRFEKINLGEAVLSVRVWEGKPYRSKQLEIFRYNNSSNIGIQRLGFNPLGWVIDGELFEDLKSSCLAENDGLSKEDFQEWFRKSFNIDSSKVIIHFTDFRYSESHG